MTANDSPAPEAEMPREWFDQKNIDHYAFNLFESESPLSGKALGRAWEEADRDEWKEKAWKRLEAFRAMTPEEQTAHNRAAFKGVLKKNDARFRRCTP